MADLVSVSGLAVVVFMPPACGGEPGAAIGKTPGPTLMIDPEDQGSPGWPTMRSGAMMGEWTNKPDGRATATGAGACSGGGGSRGAAGRCGARHPAGWPAG